MFNGKKEKVLEEQLRKVSEQSEHRKRLLKKMAEKQDAVLEQFAEVTASRAQMERDMQQAEEYLEHITELTDSSIQAAGELQSGIIAINNAVESFEVNHSIFLRQRKEQNEKIMEVVEKNKHFTTPMKYIFEMPAAMKEESRKIHEKTAKMMEFSKNMEILSLNAAIEAGRMGETGTGFIAAAEEIREFSEKHEKEIMELEEALKQSEAGIGALEEQIHHLNELLKENNISMGRLLNDGMMGLSSYEAGQVDLRSVIPEKAVGQADAMLQAEKETGEVHEHMKFHFENIRNEIKEQKDSVDELETIFKELQQSITQGQAD